MSQGSAGLQASASKRQDSGPLTRSHGWGPESGLPLQVYLNGTVLPIKSFQEYCELYLGDKLTGGPREYLKVSDRWEVCVAPTDGQFQQARAGPFA